MAMEGDDRRDEHDPQCTDEYDEDDPRRLIPAPIYDDEDQLHPPEWILLDGQGYAGARENGSTARGRTRDGDAVRVTFWTARPPRVSCFTVRCATLLPSNMPRILATEDDIAFLRVPVRDRRRHLGRTRTSTTFEYFVYQADAGGSVAISSSGIIKRRPAAALHSVPSPPRDAGFDDRPALLRCRDRDTYHVAMLCRRRARAPYNNRDSEFLLHVYSSETREWSTTPMDLPDGLVGWRDYSNTRRAITIGGEGGTVGWVDLWRGILLCDVFRLLGDGDDGDRDNNRRLLRYVPLPVVRTPDDDNRCSPQ